MVKLEANDPVYYSVLSLPVTAPILCNSLKCYMSSPRGEYELGFLFFPRGFVEEKPPVSSGN